MGTPSWLYYLFALLMLAVAGYGLVLLYYSVLGRHHSCRDVDIAHIAMGVSMAGMFVPRWAFGPSVAWELIFAALLVWFIVRSLQSIQHFGLHKPHEVIHATMSFAMLLMYWYPVGSTSGASGMAMSAAPGAARLDPGLGFALAFSFLASSIFTLASPVKGISHHGTHAFAYASSGAARPTHPRRRPIDQSPVLASVESLVTKPVLEDMSHVVMAIGMGFMLILML
jgi:Domain of unknown function (DUF5134)